MIARLLALALLVPAAHAAAPAKLDTFQLLRPAETGDLRLSRDGTRLAVTSAGDHSGLITVLATDTLKPIQQWKLPAGQFANELRWVGDREFVFRVVGTVRGLYGLAPQQGPLNLLSEGRNETRNLRVTADERVLAIVPGAEPALMVEGIDNNRRALFRVSLADGDRDLVATGNSIRGSFVLDAEHRPRYFFGEDNRRDATVLERRGDDWTVLHEGRGDAIERVPERIARDGRRVYFLTSRDGGPRSLQLFDPDSGESTSLSRDERYDVTATLPSADGRDLVAVAYAADRPRVHFVDGKHPDAVVYKQLMRAFPDHALQFIDASADGGRFLFRAHSDRDPGQFYLFDKASGEARFLMAARPWLDPAIMVVQEPVRFTARDGQPIDGYLWKPAGAGKDLPMVVRPHGGPHDIRDAWGFDEEAQLLASRGYAVLSVNFRGSGGYGQAFQAKGYRQWGRAMIDDITDATRWAIGEGIAARDRVCIYGVSYGGYAALMSVVREPNLYRCAAGMSGVYDIRAMFRHDRRRSEWLGNYFEDVFPEAMDEREWQSPSYRAADIKVPVFLAHGTADLRVPTEQFQRMGRNLRAAGNAPDEMLVEGEGHGFQSLVNRLRFYRRLLAFFDKNLGS